MKIEELNIEVEDVDDYNSQATDILEALCMDLEKIPINTREPNEDDLGHTQDWAFIWSNNADRQIREEIGRLYSIGRKYFGEEADLDISTHMYIEP